MQGKATGLSPSSFQIASNLILVKIYLVYFPTMLTHGLLCYQEHAFSVYPDS